MIYGLPYPPKKIWPDTFDHQPDRTFSQRNDRGYDVVASQVSESRRQSIRQSANGLINNGQWQFPIFVWDVSIDVALSGKMAQSPFTRDFYPHNFTQPSFVVSGETMDQRDYGALCNFIHHIQRGQVGRSVSLAQLQIFSRGLSLPPEGTVSHEGRRAVKVNGKLIKSQNHPNKGMRGPSVPIMAQGYILSMPQEYDADTKFPTYQFTFAVAKMFDGPYEDFGDITIQSEKQKTWVDMLNATKKGALSTFSDIANTKKNKALINEAQANVTWATNNSANIFNTGDGNASAPSNTGSDPTLVNNISPPSGLAWRVQASQESNDLALNSGPGCGSHTTSASLNGWSELQNCGSLGGVPCDTELYIQANGKTVRAMKVDCGGGSSFNPVIGLYPAVSSLLGVAGGQYSVTIWRVDGQPLNVASGGTRV